jgi:RNA polymerase sigma-70 factor (ECF subfamily)
MVAEANPRAGNPAETARVVERLYTEFAPRIHRLARRLLGNDTDAEDVTQDVFVQVLRKFALFRGEAALATWLYRVAVNSALAYRRKRSARLRHESSGDPEAVASGGRHRASLAHREHPADEPILEGETHQLIDRALDGLPEEARAVLVLADMEGCSCPEIAGRLGLSVAAVRSRLHRGRLLLRRALLPYFQEEAA